MNRQAAANCLQNFPFPYFVFAALKFLQERFLQDSGKKKIHYGLRPVPDRPLPAVSVVLFIRLLCRFKCVKEGLDGDNWIQ